MGPATLEIVTKSSTGDVFVSSSSFIFRNQQVNLLDNEPTLLHDIDFLDEMKGRAEPLLSARRVHSDAADQHYDFLNKQHDFWTRRRLLSSKRDGKSPTTSSHF